MFDSEFIRALGALKLDANLLRGLAFAIVFVVVLYPIRTLAEGSPPAAGPTGQKSTVVDLAQTLKVGDIVFIRVGAKPFREVAAATQTWTNHVGIVIQTDGAEPLIGESTFPLARATALSKFVARSEQNRVAVVRLKTALSEQQIRKIQVAVRERDGIIYDTGFDLHSKREFCSRYVYEVVKESTGISVGEVETFEQMLAHNPAINLGFWKWWYFGQIPWKRETITPASLLNSSEVVSVFNGNVVSHSI